MHLFDDSKIVSFWYYCASWRLLYSMVRGFMFEDNLWAILPDLVTYDTLLTNDGLMILFFPELFLGFSVFMVLPLIVYFTNNVVSVGRSLMVQTSYLCSLILFFLFCLYGNVSVIDVSFFFESYARDSYSIFFILLIILSILIFCLLGGVYSHKRYFSEYEIIFLFLFVLCGSIMIVFANDFLCLYLGIELQSLCLYILASSKPNSTFSTEAGLKYFVLGAFASSLFLFGVTLIYGFTGMINFTDLRLFLATPLEDLYILEGFWLGILFVLIGVFFKVGGVPFHFWLPDVYEGSPLLITAFFSVVPKISLFYFIYKLINTCGIELFESIYFLLNTIGLLSILVGSVGALMQYKVKRLLSYSAIGHTGFVLLGLGTGTLEGCISMCLYLLVYSITLVSLFTLLLSSLNLSNKSSIKYISNLRMIYQNSLVHGFCLVILFFSLAGVPPLSGFFSKTYIFLSLVVGGSYLLALIAIFLGVVGTTYYLRCVRSIMFIEDKESWLFIKNCTRLEAFLISFGVMFNISFIFIGSDILYILYNIKL